MSSHTLHSEKHKFLFGKKRKNPDSDTFREISVRPRRHLNIGRCLSFSFDDTSIQMAAVSHLGRKKKILDIRKVYIPSELKEAPGQSVFIAKAIDDFMSEFGCRGAKVSLTVSGKDTAFRSFLTPVLKSKELASAIQFEAKKQIPFPLEDCIYDFRRASKVVGSGQERYKIALQAATKRMVEQHLEPFRQRTIAVSKVYHTQDVIGYLLTYLPDFKEERSYAFINIDRNHSEISFYRGSSLEFFHISTTGSSLLGKQSDRARFDSLAQNLAAEIQTSLDYYTGQYSRSFIDKIYVYGDLTYSSELLELLNGHTGFVFERFPIEVLDCAPKGKCKFAEVLPVCLSALASAACDVHLANLLPVEDRLRQVKKKVHAWAQVFLILLLIPLAAGWAMMKAEKNIAENSLTSLTKQVNSFKSSNAYHTYNVLKRQIAHNRAYIDKIKEFPSYLSLNLKELSLLTPKPVRLFRLAYQEENPEKNLSLQGIVTSKEIPPEIMLAEYIETLNASPFFENVKLTKHVKRMVADSFEIEFQIELRGIV